MLIEALKYPLEDGDYVRTLIIGSLLLVGSIFIIPAFILLGYFARTVQNASRGTAAPRFDDYTGMFIDGLKLSAVVLIYVVGFMSLMALTSLAGGLNETAGLVMFWILVPIYFGLIYVQFSVLYHFSQEIEIKDAFQFKDILETAFSLRYLKAVLLLVIVVQLMFSILQVILLVTLVGILLIPASFIYELIVYSKLIGDVEG